MVPPPAALQAAQESGRARDLMKKRVQQLIAQVVAAATPSLRFVSPHVPVWTGPTGSRVEIVFVSSHLKNHTIGRLNRDYLRALREPIDRHGPMDSQ